jgi:hypothetical protein
MIRKELIGDVYTIFGIDSSSQLAEFYKEVVRENYEKYVGISTENRKFKYDPQRNSGVALEPGETYALNPEYHVAEVTPIDELMQEQNVEVAEPVAVTPEEPVPEVTKVVETIQMQPIELRNPQKEQAIVEEKSEMDIIKEQNTELGHKLDAAQERISDLCSELSLAKERAEVAEREAKELREDRIAMTNRLEELNAQLANIPEPSEEIKSAQTALSEKELLQALKDLGYEATIKLL